MEKGIVNKETDLQKFLDGYMFLGQVLQQLSDRVDSLENRLNGLETSNSETTNQLATNIEILSKQIHTVQENQTGIEYILRLTEENKKKNEQLTLQDRKISNLENEKTKLEEKLQIQQEEQSKQQKEYSKQSEEQKKELEQQTERITDLSSRVQELEQEKEENEQRIIGILGNETENYVKYKALYEEVTTGPWAQDAAMQLFVSNDYLTFFVKCGDESNVTEFYKKIKQMLENEEYVALADRLLDFCIYSCNKISGRKCYDRQDVQEGDTYDSYEHKKPQSYQTSIGNRYIINHVILRGILKDGNVLINNDTDDICGSYVEIMEE